MSSVVTPTNQNIFIHPYDGRIYDYNTKDSRVYLSRTISHLLKAHTNNDCVIYGFLINEINYDKLNNIFTVLLNPGTLIINLTLVEVYEPVELTLDLSSFISSEFFSITASYSIIILSSFHYVSSPIISNKLKFKIGLIDNTSSNILFPNTLSTYYKKELDRILLNQIYIDLNSGIIGSFLKNPIYSKSILLNSENKRVYPLDYQSENIKNFLTETFYY